MSAAPVIVVGAGPAGLTAAYELVARGVAPLVLERDGIVGGLARTESYRGCHFDIGGHRFYTKIEEVQRLWCDMLGDEFLSVSRLSRIHYKDRFFRYPLDGVNALRNLGLTESVRVVSSYLHAQIHPPAAEDTFESWVAKRFGRRLYETFFQRYTEKVWGIPCSAISADWAAQRIKGLSLSAAVKNALFGTNGATSLIERFRYPRLGPGMMWQQFRETVERGGGSVKLATEVARLHRAGSRITGVTVRRDGRESTLAAERFISSMPVTHLIERIEAVPDRVVRAARSLRYRAFILVGLIVNRAELFPDQWIYLHSPAVRAARIQNFKNWSSAMVADPRQTALGVEYFCTAGDSLWQMADAALIDLAARELVRLHLVQADEIESGVVYRHPLAYPVYDRGYADHVGVIRGYLANIENLQTIGRNGLHRYNNQDHSMLTGMLAVRNLFGESHDVWEVNTERSYGEELDLVASRVSCAAAP